MAGKRDGDERGKGRAGRRAPAPASESEAPSEAPSEAGAGSEDAAPAPEPTSEAEASGDARAASEDGGAPAKRKTTLKDLLRALRKKTRELDDGTIYVSEKVLKAFAKVGAKAVGPLLDLLDHEAWQARYGAVSALQRIALRERGGKLEDAATRLVALLEDDESPAVRARTVEALGGFGFAARTVLPALVRALGDRSAEVSKRAVMHVLELSDDPADLTLRMIEVLKTRKSVYARVGACQVLFHLGTAAKAAVPHLVEAIEDPSPEVREFANLALMVLRTPSMRVQIIRTASMRLQAVDGSDDDAKPAAPGKAGKKGAKGKRPAEPASEAASEDASSSEEGSSEADAPRRPVIRKKRRRPRRF